MQTCALIKDTFDIYKLLTYEGATVLGRNTKWCIASTYRPDVGRSTFNDYKQRSDMFVIIDRKTNEKWGVLFSKPLKRKFEILFKYPLSSELLYKHKRKITVFNQKDEEIEEKQLFLAINDLGLDEEKLREMFEKHGSVGCELLENQESSAGPRVGLWVRGGALCETK